MTAIAKLGQGDVTRQLRAVMQAWRGGLGSCLPEALRPGRRLVVEPQGGELVISRLGKGGRRERARLAMVDAGNAALSNSVAAATVKGIGKNDRIHLRIPAQDLLLRNMQLPLAVEDELGTMLQMGMDRYTPFPADQVYFDYRVSQRDRKTGKLGLELAVVPRKRVDAWMATLDHHQIRLHTIDVEPDGGGYNLLPAERRQRPAGGRQRLNRWLALIALLLLAVTIALPLWQQQQRAAALEQQEKAARLAAAQVMDLRDELDRTLAASQFLVAKKHQTQAIIQILDALTRLIPDGTWVEQLEIGDGKIQINGQSKRATALVSLLTRSPFFTDPVFRSPVTRHPGTGRERFNLEVTIVTEPAPGQVMEDQP